MNPYYYKVVLLADAFDIASKDTKTWNFPAMEALAELAAVARRGHLKGMQMGLGTIYSCTKGRFKVYVDFKKGYEIALFSLTGRECGVEDPVAAEILEYHRDRPDKELYAYQLLISENVPDIETLDAGYKLLLQVPFLIRTDVAVRVVVGGVTIERPKYRLAI